MSRGARAAFALAALVLGGCYRVTYPGDYPCSAAEPRCPEGLHCNGTRCASATNEARADDTRIVEARVVDSGATDGAVRPDSPSACQSWAAWKCTFLGQVGSATCADRVLTCDGNYWPWLCTCKIGGGAATQCPGSPQGVLLCDGGVIPDAFAKGCCH